jgi:hypothetical protein
MARRQVQKLSRADSRYSVLPAMARWNAWLCAFGMPGTMMPPIRSAPAGVARPAGGAASISMMNPASETPMMTSSTQPCDKKTDCAW